MSAMEAEPRVLWTQVGSRGRRRRARRHDGREDHQPRVGALVGRHGHPRLEGADHRDERPERELSRRYPAARKREPSFKSR